MLHRFWLLDPAGGTLDVMMNAHFYLGVLLADGARGGGQISPALRTAGEAIVGGAARDLDDPVCRWLSRWRTSVIDRHQCPKGVTR